MSDDDKGNGNNGHDLLAELTAAGALPTNDRRAEWLERFNKYSWDEDDLEDSMAQAVRDAKSLGLPQNFPVARRKKDGPVSVFAFILNKIKPGYGDRLMDAVKALQEAAEAEDWPVGAALDTTNVPDFWYDRKSHGYWHMADDGSYQSVNTEVALNMLSMAGLSTRLEPNGMPSEANRKLLEIVQGKGIDWAGALAGYPVGVHQVKGSNLLVTRSFTLIQPDPDAKTEAPHIMALANGLYSDKAIHLHLWRKEAYESLFAGHKNTNMAFIVVGPRDAGKSLDLDYVTVPLLGGRKANAYAFLGNKTPFNDEQIGSEVHVIDDGNPFETTEARKQFANAIKQEVASNEAWCHPKGKAGFTMPLYRRLVILANPEDIALMPELNESMEDKLIMLEAKRFAMPTGCLPLPARTDLGAREAFVDQLRKELPAYINYLLLLEPSTKDFESRRWGVAAFKDENLIKQIEEVSSTHEKHAVIQKTLFRNRDYRAESAAEVEINQLYELLCDGDYKVRAAKLFRNVRALGTALGHLSRKKDGYTRRESHGESLWNIERDAKFDEAATVRLEE